MPDYGELDVPDKGVVTTLASGQTTGPIILSSRNKLAVTCGAGITATAEYSVSSESEIVDGTATWTACPQGTVAASTTGYFIANRRMAIKVTSIGGAVTWKVTENEPPLGDFDQAPEVAWPDGADLIVGSTTGTKIATAATQKIGLWGVTPIVRPTAYTQTYATADKTHASPTTAAMTDSTTGAAGVTFAAGVGKYVLSIPIDLAAITGAGDVLTNYVPGHKFKILDVDFQVTKPATTAAKLATLNLEIGTVDVTGGAVALTSANCTPLGVQVAGSAVTAANTGSATDTLSVEAASVTAFLEGQGVLLVQIQNMDVADAVASLVDQMTKAVADLLDAKQLANALIDDLQAVGVVG